MIEIAVDELGDMLGITGRRVQQLEAEGVTVAIRFGVYDLAASVRGYVKYVKQNRSATTKEQKEEQTRLTKARADIAELQHRELNGELVRADVVRRNGYKLGLILKNNLETIADRQAAILAAEASQEKIHDILTAEVKESLDNILTAMDSIEVDAAALDVNRINGASLENS